MMGDGDIVQESSHGDLGVDIQTLVTAGVEVGSAMRLGQFCKLH